MIWSHTKIWLVIPMVFEMGSLESEQLGKSDSKVKITLCDLKRFLRCPGMSPHVTPSWHMSMMEEDNHWMNNFIFGIFGRKKIRYVVLRNNCSEQQHFQKTSEFINKRQRRFSQNKKWPMNNVVKWEIFEIDLISFSGLNNKTRIYRIAQVKFMFLF